MPTSNPVHIVLFNMDLLSTIIDNIFDDNTGGGLCDDGVSAASGRGDLARLARVCKSFCDPALDQLWHALPDFRCIIASWNSITSSNTSGYCIERLRYHTQRTKRVVYGKETMSENDVATLHRLRHLESGTPLFPSLSSLTLLVWPISVTEADLLFPPSLLSISLRGDCPPSLALRLSKLAGLRQEQMCLHLLVKRCPSLQEFNDSRSNTRPAFGRLVDPIFNLTELRTLILHSFPPINAVKALKKASRMRHLKVLLGVPTEVPDETISQVDLGSFLSLEALTISGSVAGLSTIFGSMRNQLDKVGILLQGSECHEMTRCLKLLAHNSGERLTKFILGARQKDPAATPISLLPMLRPLTGARNLKELSIVIPSYVTNHDVDVFAKAWPNLTHIFIEPPQPKPGSTIRPFADFQALIRLATQCPHLKHIRLGIDLSKPPSLEDVPDVKHGLDGLFVCQFDSRGEELLRRIAVNIHRLFPGIYTHAPEDVSEHTNWDRVLTIVSELQSGINTPGTDEEP